MAKNEKMFTGVKYNLAKMFFDKKVYEFGKLWKLKLHEKNPDAPKSPYFFNIRTPENPKPGPLGPNELDLIAWGIISVINEFALHFDAIAGIPNAGIPFINALVENIPKPHKFRVVCLDKIQTKDGRLIVPQPGFKYKENERVLLIDDVITEAGTKLEAVKAIEDSGCVAKDIIVLVDRQQGGVLHMREHGYNVYPLFRVRELTQFGLEEGYMTKEQYDEIIAYLALN